MWPWKGKSEPTSAPSPSVRPSNTLVDFTPLVDGTSQPSHSALPWSAESESDLLASSSFPSFDALIAKGDEQLESLPRTIIAASSAVLGGVAATSMVVFYGRYGKRLRNSAWITPDWLGGKRWIRGVVTSVGDADNFRLYHTPALGAFHWPLKLRQIPRTHRGLKHQTLHIRLAGVDAPEASHFGKPAQPYAEESLQWLSSKILNKKVYCQLVRKDQYSRVVAHVYIPPRILPDAFFKGKNVSLEMLKAGWATVYAQSGAEYGTAGKDEFLRVEAEAQAAWRGMWKDGTSVETPAEYKKRHAQSGLSAAAAQPQDDPQEDANEKPRSIWRLFTRR